MRVGVHLPFTFNWLLRQSPKPLGYISFVHVLWRYVYVKFVGTNEVNDTAIELDYFKIAEPRPPAAWFLVGGIVTVDDNILSYQSFLSGVIIPLR